ncbi:hypothetical protein IWX49DRAFT_572739 [Phyllosticta citricarpa]
MHKRMYSRHTLFILLSMHASRFPSAPPPPRRHLCHHIRTSLSKPADFVWHLPLRPSSSCMCTHCTACTVRYGSRCRHSSRLQLHISDHRPPGCCRKQR